MADTKISALTAASVAALANELAINEAGTSKKITLTQVQALLQTLGLPVIKRLNSQHSISSTTATEITDLKFASLVAGTYVVTYYLLCQSATSTVGLSHGLNFTGTATFAALRRYVDSGTTAVGQQMADAATSNKIVAAESTRTFSTTTPNLGPQTSGVVSTGVNCLVIIETVLIVTVSGDLAIWHASETATATSVEVGSSAVLVRTA